MDCVSLGAAAVGIEIFRLCFCRVVAFIRELENIVVAFHQRNKCFFRGFRLELLILKKGPPHTDVPEIATVDDHGLIEPVLWDIEVKDAETTIVKRAVDECIQHPVHKHAVPTLVAESAL